MLKVSVIPARVVEFLQARIDSTVPGSLEHDSAEYAIRYALSLRRNPSNEFFFSATYSATPAKASCGIVKRETKLVENVIGDCLRASDSTTSEFLPLVEMLPDTG